MSLNGRLKSLSSKIGYEIYQMVRPSEFEPGPLTQKRSNFVEKSWRKILNERCIELIQRFFLTD
jgi:hypothetical protein